MTYGAPQSNKATKMCACRRVVDTGLCTKCKIQDAIEERIGEIEKESAIGNNFRIDELSILGEIVRTI